MTASALHSAMVLMRQSLGHPVWATQWRVGTARVARWCLACSCSKPTHSRWHVFERVRNDVDGPMQSCEKCISLQGKHCEVYIKALQVRAWVANAAFDCLSDLSCHGFRETHGSNLMADALHGRGRLPHKMFSQLLIIGYMGFDIYTCVDISRWQPKHNQTIASGIAQAP